MAIIKNPITVINKGSDIVNGIIEEYKATTSTIDANTFVEFIESRTVAARNDTKLSNTTYGGGWASAIALNDTTVFIAHCGKNTYTSTASRLYGIVCTISGTTITVGTDTQLSTTAYGGGCISVTAIDENKVFVTHNGGDVISNTTSRIYGIVCTISGTTITAGTDTQLSTTKYGGASSSAIALSNNEVFVTHNGDNPGISSASRLYGIVCTISGTTITAGTDTRLSTTTYGGDGISTAKLSNGRVFVAHCGLGTGADARPYGIVCTISDTAIAPGTDTKLSNQTYGAEAISATALDENKLLVCHSGGTGNNNRLYGIVCTISDTGFILGTDTKLSDTNRGGYTISVTALSETKAIVCHSGEASGALLYGVVCTISDVTITAGTDTLLSDVASASANSVSTVLLSNGKLVVAHNGEAAYSDTNSRLYALICNVGGTTVTPSSTKIEGLTKTACTTSEAGEVWVLNN